MTEVADDGDSKALVVAEEPSGPSMEPELSNIHPIPVRKTLMIINHFVLQTTHFINNFAVQCETKLAQVSGDIQRLEIVLALLEAKLGSIDWLGGPSSSSAVMSDAPSFDAAAASSVPAAPPIGGTPGGDQKDPAPAAAAAAAPAAAAPAEAPAEEPSGGGISVSDDPAYQKYFKMLRLGVPKAQLKLKMQQEGVDPDVIDMDPMAPSPGGGSTALVKVENADSDDTDDDVSEEMSDIE